MLRKRPDFLKAQSGLKSGAPGFLLARASAPNALGETRLGFTVTRKIGNAVVRNRVKRRLREASRRVFPDFAEPGFDYVLIARAAAAARPFELLLDDMKRALLRLSSHPK
ncbi:MAG: ribonuclease P protein component [Parvularculaceae bacterium]